MLATLPSKTTPDRLVNDEPAGAPAGIRRPGRAPIRILLSEGSSLSARQMITVLGVLDTSAQADLMLVFQKMFLNT